MMTPELKGLLQLLERWFGEIMAQVMSIPPIRGDGVLLMGTAVWGSKYVDRFQSFALPSIVATKNFEALCGRCHMIVFTDEASFARIWDLCRTLESGGITTQILLIPRYIMAEMPKDPLNKYWSIGVAGNALIQIAGRLGMGFHWLFPDHLYAHEYFPNLLRLAKQHQAIVQPGISANVDTARADIEPFRNEDGNLAISDRELGTIGWNHLHPQTAACLMNRATIPTAMPNSHLLIWQGQYKLVMHCCHMNPAYLSPALCARAPTRIPATLDAELPAFIPNGEFYVPTIDDGMTYIELSDATKTADAKLVDFPTFSEGCMVRTRACDHWDGYFSTPYEIPLHGQKNGLSDDAIREQFEFIFSAMLDDRPFAAMRFVSKLAFQSAT